jgi:hypothetical protein
LAAETSPYLLQHAGNPVEWYPWGDEALGRARAENLPILLSIGYAACHWCHVMERESFEDPETAADMNRLFVNVKVDREERPDLDAVYMNAVVSLTGRGGWPMTVFLTPDGRPFYGGTYFPPQPRHGMPAFRQVLEAVAEAYRERNDEVVEAAGRLSAALDSAARIPASGEPLTDQMLVDAERGLRQVYDPRFGGFGAAPKFPPASVIEFLLREHVRSGSDDALAMAVGTLDGMALGGMFDVVGGGFARYSVDNVWLVPHFEKMLYDNALLAAAYLHAHLVTGDDSYRRVVELTLDFMLRELLLEEGLFSSSLDADTDGVEGATYVWTPADLREALGEADAAAAAAYYGVEEPGNFEGATILRPQGDPPANLEDIRLRLLAARDQRRQPARDDKAIAAWNGLALAALAEAGERLGRADYTEAAVACAEALETVMTDEDGRLQRSYRAGKAAVPAFLDDHAAVAHGLLQLHQSTGDERWFVRARDLTRAAAVRFRDPAGGFFYSADDSERLIARHKDLDDNPTPSGQSLLAYVLVRLARLDGGPDEGAEEVLRLAAPYLERSPQGFGQALCTLDLYLAPPVEVAVVGAESEARDALVAVARSGFHPTTVLAVGDGVAASAIALLEGKTAVGGDPAAYVCEHFACRAPVTDPDALAAALS